MVDKNGKVYTAQDLVSVGKDGKIRTKDGTVIEGAYMDKDGKLRNKDGSLLTPQDIFAKSAIARETSEKGTVLDGVTGKYDPAFASNIRKGSQQAISTFAPYEVEYIIGGKSNGPATTFTIQVDNKTPQQKK